jgi:hypothetical protein
MRYRQLEGIQQMIEMQQNKVWEQGPQDQGNHEALIGLGPVERPALAHDQILVASGWRCGMGNNHALVLSAVARPAAVTRRRQPNTSRPAFG